MYTLIVIIAGLFHFIINFCFFQLDNSSPIHIYPHIHLIEETLNFFRICQEDITHLLLLDISPLSFIEISANLIFSFLGFSKTILFLIPSFFLILVMLTTFLLGIIIKDKRTGSLAAVLISIYPFIYANSKMYTFHLAFIFITTLAFALLLLSAHFQNSLYSLLLGIVVGLGINIGETDTQSLTFLIFFTPLFFISLLVIPKEKYNLKLAVNVCLCLLTSVAISYRLQLFSLTEALEHITNESITFMVQNACPQDKKGDNLSFITNMCFYLLALLKQIGILGILNLLLAIITMAISKNSLKYQWHILSFFLVPLIAFSLFDKKHYYYLSSYLPVVAIISAAGLSNSRNLAQKIIYTLYVFIFLAFQYYLYTHKTDSPIFHTLRNCYDCPKANYFPPETKEEYIQGYYYVVKNLSAQYHKDVIIFDSNGELLQKIFCDDSLYQLFADKKYTVYFTGIRLAKKNYLTIENRPLRYLHQGILIMEKTKYLSYKEQIRQNKVTDSNQVHLIWAMEKSQKTVIVEYDELFFLIPVNDI